MEPAQTFFNGSVLTMVCCVPNVQSQDFDRSVPVYSVFEYNVHLDSWRTVMSLPEEPDELFLNPTIAINKKDNKLYVARQCTESVWMNVVDLESAQNDLTGQGLLAGFEVLAEFGLCDPDDRGAIA